jgi:hypothetical protein
VKFILVSFAIRQTREVDDIQGVQKDPPTTVVLQRRGSAEKYHVILSAEWTQENLPQYLACRQYLASTGVMYMCALWMSVSTKGLRQKNIGAGWQTTLGRLISHRCIQTSSCSPPHASLRVSRLQLQTSSLLMLMTETSSRTWFKQLNLRPLQHLQHFM